MTYDASGYAQTEDGQPADGSLEEQFHCLHVGTSIDCAILTTLYNVAQRAQGCLKQP